jgi:probable F420-dependent oxidoreductase
MRWGINLPTKGTLAGPRSISAVAGLAEKLGFSSVWASDHVVLPTESTSRHPSGRYSADVWDPGVSWFEPLLALCWAAAYTEKTRLGTSILILPQRDTLLVAKQVATLDQFCQGRVILGVGSGWIPEEFALLGHDFVDRGPRMSEAIKLLRAAWSDEVVTFSGRFHPDIPFGMGPKPHGRRDVPVLIGGTSQPALTRVAEVGSGWHPSNLPPAAMAEHLTRLDALLAREGRSRDELEVVVRCPPHLRGAALMRAAAEYEVLGAQELVVEIDYSEGDLASSLEKIERLAAEALGNSRPHGVAIAAHDEERKRQ